MSEDKVKNDIYRLIPEVLGGVQVLDQQCKGGLWVQNK